MQTISASRFKAQCLAILDEVAATGEIVVIVKRGKPVAQLVPPVATTDNSPQDELRGTVSIQSDVVAPALPPETWDAEQGRVE